MKKFKPVLFSVIFLQYYLKKNKSWTWKNTNLNVQENPEHPFYFACKMLINCKQFLYI